MSLLTITGRSVRTSAVLIGLMAFGLMACTDALTEAPDTNVEVILTPKTQWAGGIVAAQSAALAHLILVSAEDSTGAAQPNRYTNLVVAVDGDTVDSWQTGMEEISFLLPNPKLTGTATVEVYVQGRRQSPAHVDVVGSAWPPRYVTCGSAPDCQLPRLGMHIDLPLYIFYHGVGLPTGQLLAFFGTASIEGGGIGVANLDNPTPTLDLLPGLRVPGWFREGNAVGLVAPGDAVGAQEWLIDISAYPTAQPPVIWRIGSSLGPVGSLQCLPEGVSGAYAVAELPSGDCLVLTGPAEKSGALLLNGEIPMPGYEAIPPGWSAGCAAFRSAPGNRWITFRSLEGEGYCWDADPANLPAWPVFGEDGNLAFSSSRYRRWVRGADFTPTGDTLWVVGATPEWSLDAWDPTTGALLSEYPLEDLAHCDDVIVDPVHRYVFIACRRGENSAPIPWSVRPSLVVFDRTRGEVVAILDSSTSEWPFLPPIALVYGGSSGRVHATGVWDGTTSAVERGVTVLSWDVQ